MAAESVCELAPDIFEHLLSRDLQQGFAPAAAVGRALCDTFLELDRMINERFAFSGCTLSLLVQHGWDLHVASVGDSRVVLYDGAAVLQLTFDFRVEDSARERERITGTGATVGRLAAHGRGPAEPGEEGCGPMRVWPGGLCLSRAIGDPDVGDCILPHPFYKHVRVPARACRAILATDGVWDALTNQVACSSLRDLNTEAASTELVDLAIARRGLRDDTTAVVVDLTPGGEEVAESWGAAPPQGGLCGLCAPQAARPSASHPARPPLSPARPSFLLPPAPAQLAPAAHRPSPAGALNPAPPLPRPWRRLQSSTTTPRRPSCAPS